MKKYIKTILLLVIFIPLSVNANIMCNDGTVSPSCADCHRGCCSHHGGCASSYSYDEIPTTKSKKTTTKLRKTTTSYNSSINKKSEDDESEFDITKLSAYIGAGVLGGCAIGYLKNKD